MNKEFLQSENRDVDVQSDLGGRIVRRLFNWRVAAGASLSLAGIVVAASLLLAHMRNGDALPLNSLRAAIDDLANVSDSLLPDGSEDWNRRLNDLRERATQRQLSSSDIRTFFKIYTPAHADGRYTDVELSELNEWLEDIEPKASTGNAHTE